MSAMLRSMRGTSCASTDFSTSSYSAEALAAWLRCQYCQPFQAA